MSDKAETLASQFPVNWGSMAGTNLMDQDECSVVQRFQQMSEDEIQERLSDQSLAKELGAALTRLARVTADKVGVGLACALSAIVLDGTRARADLFANAEGALPVQEFVRIVTLDSLDNQSVKVNACKVVAALLNSGSEAQIAHFSVEPLLKWVNDMIALSAPDAAVSESNLIGLRAAGALFHSRIVRLAFINTNGIHTLCDYIAHKPKNISSDAVYRASFCLWALSYHDEVVPALCSHNTVVHLVSKNLPHIDDKISRLALSTLVNLLNQEDAEQGVQLNDVMVEANIGKCLLELTLRKWTNKDQKDVDTDIATLNNTLKGKFSAMNSFDRYLAEVTTGTLKEGGMHTSKFWSENVSSFEHKEFLAIRLLVNLLSSEDDTTVVLACRDLGEFARFYDGGKKIIQHYKGKVKIMKLMGHENRDVQKAAILASAKLLITNWEHV